MRHGASGCHCGFGHWGGLVPLTPLGNGSDACTLNSSSQKHGEFTTSLVYAAHPSLVPDEHCSQ
jgi:hypothetical protein